VAKLVEAGLNNTVALMGCDISQAQIQKLLWIKDRIPFPQIVLFMDRDDAGRSASLKIQQKLTPHRLQVKTFDWQQIDTSYRDPADLPVSLIQSLQKQGIL